MGGIVAETSWAFCEGGVMLPLLITVADVLWAPWLSERYRMDIYWLMGMMCFIVIGFYGGNMVGMSRKKFSCSVCIWSVVTMCTCFLLFLVPHDANYTQVAPGFLVNLRGILRFDFF